MFDLHINSQVAGMGFGPYFIIFPKVKTTSCQEYGPNLLLPLSTFCPNSLKIQAAGVTCSCFGSAFKRLRMQAKTKLICAVRFCFRHRISMWLSIIDSVCSGMGGQSCPEISAMFGTYMNITSMCYFFPKALRRVLPENPLNTYTSTLTLMNTDTSTLTLTHTHTHWKSESIQVRSMPVSKYASVSMQA